MTGPDPTALPESETRTLARCYSQVLVLRQRSKGAVGLRRTGASRWDIASRRGLTVLPYLIYLALVAFTLATPQSDMLHQVGSAVTRIVLESLALAFSVVAARHPRLDLPQRRPWRYVATAVAALLFAEIVTAASILGVEIGAITFTVPTLARLVFLALFLRTLFLFGGPRRRPGAQRWRVALDGLTVVAGGATWTWYFVFGPALPRLAGAPSQIWQGALISTVAHLILFFGLSAVLLRGTTTTARGPMLLLIGAGVIGVVLDLYSVNAVLNQGQPESETLMAIGPPITDALLASAAIEQCHLAASGRQLRQRVLGRPTWLPYVGAGVGFLALVLAAARATPYPWWGLVAGATVTTLAVMSRQFLALRDNDRLVAQDSITGLASRMRLLERLQQVAEIGPRLGTAVLQIDLDGFKRINDEYGHEAGDAYLAAFGAVVRDSVRRGDLAARVGGDEFAVLLSDSPSVEQCSMVAERILQAARHPTNIAGHLLSIRASIGIAISEGVLDVDQILRQADQAMYVAKRRGLHDWELYSEATTEDR
jgi:diguanylate cyclase (GGDEF)-like protein